MTDWTGNKKSTYVTLGASNHSASHREKNDYYATEPKTIDGLISLNILDKKLPILEPACGQGHLSKKLIELGYEVESRDLIDRGYGLSNRDFLLETDKWNGNIVTNPPYKYAMEFVLKSLDIIEDGNLVCMFLKTTFLEGKKRADILYNNFKPIIVGVYSDRMQCSINGEFKGSSAACYSWFIWQKGNADQDPIIKFIRKNGEIIK